MPRLSSPFNFNQPNVEICGLRSFSRVTSKSSINSFFFFSVHQLDKVELYLAKITTHLNINPEKHNKYNNFVKEMSGGLCCPFSPCMSALQWSFIFDKHEIVCSYKYRYHDEANSALFVRGPTDVSYNHRHTRTAITVFSRIHKPTNLIVTPVLNWRRTAYIGPYLWLQSN